MCVESVVCAEMDRNFSKEPASRGLDDFLMNFRLYLSTPSAKRPSYARCGIVQTGVGELHQMVS